MVIKDGSLMQVMMNAEQRNLEIGCCRLALCSQHHEKLVFALLDLDCSDGTPGRANNSNSGLVDHPIRKKWIDDRICEMIE